MYKFGTIVLVPFPFTDLSGHKTRPALIISQDNHPGNDVILCFISTKAHPRHFPQFIIKANEATGLSQPSTARFDKIATLEKKLILGELGNIDRALLKKQKSSFTNNKKEVK